MLFGTQIGFPGLLGDAHGNTALTAIRIDGAGEQIGFKFYAAKTSPITHIDMYMDINGTVTGINFTLAMYSDSSGVPNAILNSSGAISSAFAGLAADGWTGAQALGSNSGTLTLNTPYWAVLTISSGTPDASNWVGARAQSTSATSPLGLRHSCRHHNGTNWTTTTPVGTPGCVVFTHADGSFSGYPVTAGSANSAMTDIFGTNRQAIRMKYGSKQTIKGVYCLLGKAGSPSNLEIKVYEGNTEKQSQTVTAADITSGTAFIIWFTTPVAVAADTNIYIVLGQAADGGTDAADYDIRCITINSSYISVFQSSDYRTGSFTGTTPDSSFSASSTEIATLVPLYLDLATDLDETAAAGGGLITNPGMGGGFH